MYDCQSEELSRFNSQGCQACIYVVIQAARRRETFHGTPQPVVAALFLAPSTDRINRSYGRQSMSSKQLRGSGGGARDQCFACFWPMWRDRGKRGALAI